MILVTFAVPFESAAFRKRAISRSVRIIHTGVGADAARVALEQAVCEAVPESVIASGFAGALTPDLKVGEIVCDREEGAWRFARFGMADAVLAGPAAKQEFRARTGADIVDMESDAIREVCGVAGVPLAMLRAISDGADDDLGLPPELLADLAAAPLKTIPRLVGTLVSDSSRRKAFLRLVRDCRTAQRALADALEQEIGARITKR